MGTQGRRGYSRQGKETAEPSRDEEQYASTVEGRWSNKNNERKKRVFSRSCDPG